jgi:pimeloyl-ACP methyl ester carboxylesterase
MPTANVNGVQLFYEVSGKGEIPLVLVHGAWSSHHNFDRVAPGLARSFKVITYDRRGHSQSECPPGQGRMSEDVADLAELVEHLDIVPAWAVGTSSGANIALRLASQRPELLHGVIAHEPGFFSLLEGDSTFSSMLDQVDQVKGIVLERIAGGDHAGAAQYFIEAALGPGGWERTPTQLKQTYIENAPTFLDDMKDPEHFAFDPNWFKGFSKPILLTQGDQSPPYLTPVVARLAEILPQAEVVTYVGAGHTPHTTHPDAYVELITSFIRKHTT